MNRKRLMYMKVGIIGCGSIARFRHAPEYSQNPYVTEIVFYDRNPERAVQLADLFAGSVVETVDELLKDEEIIAVSDCSSNESHHIFSTDALLHGKHVLCEKPIALTIEHANKIINAQKQSGNILMVGHNQRFNRAHKKVKEIIATEAYGKVLTFQTTFGHGGPESWGVTKSNATWFFKKDRSGLGVNGDLGIHKIDLLHFLLDDQIDVVSAMDGAIHKVGETGKPIAVPDNVVATIRMKKGALGTATFSWTHYGQEDNSTTIYCERAIIKIYDDPYYQVKIMTHDGEEVNYRLEKMQTNDEQTNTGIIDAFIHSIRQNKRPPVTGEDALNALKVILAIDESAKQGVHIQIK